MNGITEKIHEFRRTLHLVYCGKYNETDKCNNCPASRQKLTQDTWGKVRIADMMDMKGVKV